MGPLLRDTEEPSQVDIQSIFSLINDKSYTQVQERSTIELSYSDSGSIQLEKVDDRFSNAILCGNLFFQES